MFWFMLLITLATAFWSKEEYNNNRIGMAMFWSAMFGWDLHILISLL